MLAPSEGLPAMSSAPFVAVLGGGPAGLMAAEVIAAGGCAVEVFDAMPSVGRKLLMAGRGGLNITHDEPRELFLSRYGARAGELAALIDAFDPRALREWMSGLGVESFVGTSGKVFPVEMKAAPLLRAWLHRLREAGVEFHSRHRWLGWGEDGALRFTCPDGELARHFDACVLALGGGSWAKLGSDGAWVSHLAGRGVAVAPLKPSNCGFNCGWSAHFREHFAGDPVKNIAARAGDGPWRRGEAMVRAHGIEGGLVYALSAPLRDALEEGGGATLWIDLLPDLSAAKVRSEVAHPRGSRSLSSHLKSRLGLAGVKAALLREALSREEFNDPARLAAAIKELPVKLTSPRPIDEAISSAGGVRFDALTGQLMLRALPGVFCAGEMLDWEAPTGGYLLTGCLASGRAAGRGVLEWLSCRPTAG
jgi:uncharacterized flavoprotein (TIGR03862 family)